MNKVPSGRTLLLLLIFILIFNSCEESVKNDPPTKPILLTPKNKSSIRPDNAVEFTWQKSTNTNGDAIVYTLYLGTDVDSLNIEQKDLQETDYTRKGLRANTTYYWKVTAKNSKGRKTNSDLFTFTTPVPNAPPTMPILIAPQNQDANVDTASIVLSWNASNDNDGDDVTYTVNLGTDRDNLQVQQDNLSDTTYMLKNLSRETDYFWQVTASDGSGATSSSDIFTFTTQAPNTPPTAPMLIAPQNQDANVDTASIVLSWNASNDNDGDDVTYTVNLGTDRDNLQVQQDNLSDTTYMLKSLSRETDYFWQVTASDGSGATSSSDIFTFTTQAPNTPPTAPMLIAPQNRVTNVDTASVSLSWNASNDNDGDDVTYTVNLGTDRDNLQVQQDNLSDTTYTLKDLSGETNYFWQVTASDNRGGNTTSQVFTFTTQASSTPPTAPTLTAPQNQATNVDTTSVPLSWNASNDNDGDDVTYTVNLGTDRDNLQVQQDNLSDTTYTLKNLRKETDYFWQVTVFDNRGGSATSQVFTFTTQAPNTSPTAPMLIAPQNRATNIDTASVTVSWNAANDNDGDDVTYTVSLGKDRDNLQVQQDNLSDTTYTLKNLREETDYFWQVTASDNRGGRTTSDVFTFITQIPNTPPTAPALIKPENQATNVDTTSVILSWSASRDDDGDDVTYTIRLGANRDNLQVQQDNLSDTTYVVSEDLNKNTDYFWQVTARDSRGKSSTSDVFTFTTYINCESHDQEVLIKLYNATNGAKWIDNSNWRNKTVSLKDWFGVKTDDEGCVVELELQSNNISGEIPHEISNLASLKKLRLQSNALVRTIPVQLKKLTQLTELDLSNNLLSGEIPRELEELTELTKLDLSNNRLSGEIPAEVGNLSNLKTLFLQENYDLAGAMPGNLCGIENLNFTSTGLVCASQIELLAPPNNATEISNPSLTLIWGAFKASVGKTTYTVRLGTARDNLQVQQDNLSDTTYTLKNLNEDTDYFWQVIAGDNAKGTFSSDVFTFTTQAPNTPPTAPTLITPQNQDANIDTTLVTLSWNVAGDDDGDGITYTVSVGTDRNNLRVQQENLSDTTYALRNLNEGTDYFWQVTASNSRGESATSDVFTFTTQVPNTPPTAPNLIEPRNQAVNVDTTSVILSWHVVDDDDGDDITYTVSVGTDRNNLRVQQENLSDTTYTLKNLNEGTNYFWQVTAGDNRGERTTSDVFTFATQVPNTPPTAPNLIEPRNQDVNVGTTSAILSWHVVDDDDGDDITYTVSVGTDRNNLQVQQDNLSDTTYTLKNLNEGTDYFWQVTASDNRGESATSDVFTFTTRASNTPPTMPTLIVPQNRATNVDTTSVTLSWNADNSGDDITYMVRLGTDRDSLQVQQDNLADTTYTLKNLREETDYFWQVTANNNRGESATSDMFTFTTQVPNTSPTAPNLIEPRNQAANVDTTSVTLSWHVANDDDGDDITYAVRLGTDRDSLQVQQDNIFKTTYTLKNLSAETSYFWQVIANDNKGGSSVSQLFVFTTQQRIANSRPTEPLLIAPQNQAANVDTTSLTLSWNAATDVDGDDITYELLLISVGMNGETTEVEEDNLVDTTYTLQRTLKEGTTHFWRVTASDNKGGRYSSEMFTFTTQAPNTPPTAPTLITPQNQDANIDTTLVTLSWNVAGDDDGDGITYTVSLGTDKNNLQVQQDNLSDTTYTLRNLNEGTDYFWQVTVSDNRGGSATSDVFTFTTQVPNTPPTAPNLIEPRNQAANVDTTSVTLSWHVANDDDGDDITYAVRLGTDRDSLQVQQDNIFKTTYTLKNLSAETSYFWQVIANDDKGGSSVSQLFVFTTQQRIANSRPTEPLLIAPQNQATNVDTTSLTLSWNAATDVDGDDITYELLLISVGMNGETTEVEEDNLVDTTYTLQRNLKEGTTHFWRVTASDNRGGSYSSEMFTFTTQAPNTPPTAPTLITPQNQDANIDTTLVTLSWNVAGDDDGDGITYTVSLGTDKNNLQVQQDNLSDTTYTLRNLNEGTDYFWQVTVSDNRGGSATSDVFTFTTQVPNTPPTAPNLIEPRNQAANVDTTSVTLSWHVANDDDGDDITYAVRLGTDRDSLQVQQDNIFKTTYTLKNLSAETSYFWQVIANDDKGGSSVSQLFVFTTQQRIANSRPTEPLLIAPQNQATNVDTTSLTLSWNAATDVDGDDITYELLLISVGMNGETTEVEEDNLVDTTYTLQRNLKEGTTHFWRVTASDNRGGSYSSEMFTFTTQKQQPPPNTPPTDPLLVAPQNQATNVDTTSVTLSWNTAIDDDGDDVTYTVSLGTDRDNLEVQQDNLPNATYTLKNLNEGTDYFWQVTAFDNKGGSAASTVFTFTTTSVNP